jgi:RNA polymerase sigma factor (sigma-70 family)
MENRTFENEIMPLLDSAYNFARFLSGDANAANSIVQAALLWANRNLETARGEKARAWLLKIVRDCYQAWLIGLRQKPIPDSAASSVIRSEDDRAAPIAVFQSDSDAVRLAIETMPRRLREVLVLREFEDFSYQEIAEVTSLTRTEVLLRLVGARRRLCESLAPPLSPARPVLPAFR